MISQGQGNPCGEPKTPPSWSGCHSPDTESCPLRRPRRPRFFRGQLLSDEDLKELVAWTRERLALQRFRTGWGAACGLHVRIHPEKSGHVIVAPGYGVGPCGNDLVLPCDQVVSLKAACPSQAEECEDPEQGEGPKGKNPGSLCPPDDDKDLVLVDLFLKYAEKPEDPRPSLRPGECGERRLCEYSRVIETAEVVQVPGEKSSKNEETGLPADYLKCFERLEGFFDKKPKTPDALGDFFRSWIEECPPAAFNFLNRCIEDEIQNKKWKKDTVSRLLFYLVQDCRNRYFASSCSVHCTHPGIKLARVWLRQNGSDFSVVGIDDFPPHRRNLSPQEDSVVSGKIDLSRFIWQRYEEACPEIKSLGVESVTFNGPMILDDPTVLEALFIQEPGEILSAGCDTNLEVIWSDLGLFGSRIVAFKKVHEKK